MIKKLWNRISNTKSLLAIASAVLIITNAVGMNFDDATVMQVVNAILFILVTLGIINNSGMETSKWNK